MVHVCSDVSGKHTAIFSVTIWFREMLKWFGRKGVSHLCRKVGKKSYKSDLRTLRENPTNRTYAHSEKIRKIGLPHITRKSGKSDFRTFRENPTHPSYAHSPLVTLKRAVLERLNASPIFFSTSELSLPESRPTLPPKRRIPFFPATSAYT